MGLLNRSDSTMYRGYFTEMCKLIGISVGYQYVTKQELTIHSEDNCELSMPIRLNIIFDENPSVKTLNKLGWITEIGEERPIIATLPYNTPKLTVNARLIVESIDGTPRPRVFKITKISSDLEFPDAYTCAIVPVYDQYTQKNQYTLVNTEKINEEAGDRTSKEQPYQHITNQFEIDTTPKDYIDYENTYTYINDKNSPFSD